MSGGQDKKSLLTNKEYALLEFLLRNKNRVLTRTAIIEHVWDISYDPMTNIVDAHIRALRAKIDRDFSPPLIATVRGAGYMLEEPESLCMKSLHSLISWSAFVLMAGLLVFSALVYSVSEILLHRFVDGQLFTLAETLAEFVEQHPGVLRPDGARTARWPPT